jgi:exosortase
LFDDVSNMRMTSARLTGIDREALMRSPGAWAALVGAAIGAIAYGPLLVEFFSNLWGRPHYQHFPFVLAGFAWLMATRLSASRQLPDQVGAPSMAPGLVLGAVAWALLALAYYVESPWLGYVSLLVLLAAVLKVLIARREAPGVWATWMLLWVILPPPMSRDEYLITEMQRLSSGMSSFVLDALGVLHLMEGNVLVLPDKQFFVDKACSGIISVISIIACAAIYGVWRRRTLMHVLVLAVAGVAWATFMNTMRISAVAVAYSQWGIDWSAGTPHEILSLCVFMLTFLALVSTDVLLAGLLAPIGSAWIEHYAEPVHWGSMAVRYWDRVNSDVAAEPDDEHASSASDVSWQQPVSWPNGRRFSWALMAGGIAAFIMLPAIRLLRAQEGQSFGTIADSELAQSGIVRAKGIDADVLPTEIVGLKRVKFTPVEREFDDVMGNFSRSYEYQDANGRIYLVSLDFPYEGGWHELTYCYQGIGWSLKERLIDKDVSTTAAQGPWQILNAQFSKPEGGHALLLACAFDERGNPINLPTLSFIEEIWQTLTRRQPRDTAVAFQVQVWTIGGRPNGDAERDVARRLLLEARQRFQRLIAPPTTADRAQQPRSASAIDS